MANRGGRGGDPVAFNTGGGEGAGPAPAAAGGGGNPPKKPPKTNPFEAHDYEGEWADRKLTPNDRPSIPGSVDRDGLDKGNQAEIAHHTKRQKAFDAAYAKQQAERPKTTKKGPYKSPRPKPKPVTNKTPGVHVPQKTGILAFGQMVAGLHTILDAHAKSVGSLQLRPEAAEMHNQATGHLDDAKKFIDKAEVARRGVVVGNKRISGDSVAGEHYISALRSVRKAHDALGHESITTAATLNKVTAHLPTPHLEDAEAAATTIPVTKNSAPFKTIPLGGVDVDPMTIDVKQVEKIMGKEADVTKKVKAGRRGTAKRQNKFRVVTGEEEQSLGGLPGQEVRGRGRKGIVSTPMNPKRRASRTRRVEDRVRPADMSRFETPRSEGVDPTIGTTAPKPSKPTGKVAKPKKKSAKELREAEANRKAMVDANLAATESAPTPEELESARKREANEEATRLMLEEHQKWKNEHAIKHKKLMESLNGES